VKATRKGNLEPLIDILFRFEPSDLKDIFIVGKTKILDLLENDKISEYLTWVLLPSNVIT
jgi:hypothetical protein